MKRKKYIKIPVNSLLERVNTQNKSVKDILKKIRVKETYVGKFPTDELGNDISDDLTYFDLFNGMLEGKDIYDMLNVSDSLIRERVLKKLSDIMGVDYDIVYYLWLNY